jgi:hypothetical protein
MDRFSWGMVNLKNDFIPPSMPKFDGIDKFNSFIDRINFSNGKYPLTSPSNAIKQRQYETCNLIHRSFFSHIEYGTKECRKWSEMSGQSWTNV